MNTSRLQLIIEDLVEDVKDNADLLSLLGELVEEISTTYNAPSDWKVIGKNLEEAYREDELMYEHMDLNQFTDF